MPTGTCDRLFVNVECWDNEQNKMAEWTGLKRVV